MKYVELLDEAVGSPEELEQELLRTEKELSDLDYRLEQGWVPGGDAKWHDLTYKRNRLMKALGHNEITWANKRHELDPAPVVRV